MSISPAAVSIVLFLAASTSFAQDERAHLFAEVPRTPPSAGLFSPAAPPPARRGPDTRWGVGIDGAMHFYWAEHGKDIGKHIGASVFLDWFFARSPEGAFALSLRPRAGGGISYAFGEGVLEASFGDIHLVAGINYYKNWDKLGSYLNTAYELAPDDIPQSMNIIGGLGFTIGNIIVEGQYRTQIEPAVQLVVYPGPLWGETTIRRLPAARYNTLAVWIGWMF